MTLQSLMEALDREQTLAEHYHANSQTWKLAVSLAKIQDIARKAESECNELVMDHEYGRPKPMYHRLGCQCEQCLRIAP